MEVAGKAMFLASVSSGNSLIQIYSEFDRFHCSKPKSLYRTLKSLRASFQGTTKVNGRKLNGSKLNERNSEEIGVGNHESCNNSVKQPTFGTITLAATDKKANIDRKADKTEVPLDVFRLGRLVEDILVYRQTFVIRSYEVGADKTASIETLMNHLQETALNQVRLVGLARDGFGATHAMSRRNLIWVVTRMQIQVERYSSWGDVVEIDTWVAASGKNGMRRDWLVRDYKSGQILTRATSTWVMMNKETRKLSKFPKEVREEIEPYYLERSAIVGDDAQKIYKLDDDTAENIRSGLSPRWSDMDVNQHVNNVKYIGWILESVPIPILRNHDLANMIIEFRRECRPSYMLQSLTSLKCNDASIDSRSTTPFSYTSGFSDKSKSLCALRCTHLLRLQEDGSEIVRGRTEWRPKEMKNFHNLH